MHVGSRKQGQFASCPKIKPYFTETIGKIHLQCEIEFVTAGARVPQTARNTTICYTKCGCSEVGKRVGHPTDLL